MNAKKIAVKRFLALSMQTKKVIVYTRTTKAPEKKLESFWRNEYEKKQKSQKKS